MPLVAPSNSAQNATRASHRFPGGHAPSPLLNGAARLEIAGLSEAGFEVALQNVGVGHNFPTGGAHPARAVLSVAVTGATGRPLWAESRTFSYGDTLGRVALRLDRPVVDTTLKPRERRIERFTVPPGLKAYKVRAVLTYHLLPPGYDKDLPPRVYAEFYRPSAIGSGSAQWRAATSPRPRLP
jgi:hypothetical protein